MNRKENKTSIFIFLLLVLVEGIAAVIATALIAADPKNAVLLGLSKSRLLLIAIELAILCVFVFFLFRSNKLAEKLETRINRIKRTNWLSWVGFFAAVILWVTIWLPAERLGILAATFVRFRPLLLWTETIVFELYILIQLIRQEIDFGYFKRFIISHKRTAWWLLAAVLLFSILLFLYGNLVPITQRINIISLPALPSQFYKSCFQR
jgi:hypothetical protein